MQHLDEGTLQAWLDRPRSGLDPSEVADIGRHLAACETCTARLSELGESSERTRALLSVGGTAVASPPPYDRIAERAAGTRRRRRAQKRLTVMAWAASIVVAIGVGWLTNDLYRTGTELQLRAPRREPVTVQEPTAEADEPAPSRSPQVSADEARTGAAQGRSAPPVEEERQRPSVEAPAPPPSGVQQAAPVAPPPGAGAAAPPAATQAAPRSAARDAVQAGGPPPAVAEKETAVAAEPMADAAARPVETAKPVVVSGRVVDEQGDPVASAQVFVQGRDIGVLTRQDGDYSLTLPEPADSDSTSFDLTVQRIGFGEQTRALTGRVGDSLTADFRLEEQALQLQEVIVTGTPEPSQRRALGNSVRAPSASPWLPATRAAADDALGMPVRAVPGLAVLSFEVDAGGGEDGRPLVRVRQELGDGLALTLIEGRSDTGRDRWSVTADGSVDSVRIGDLLITGSAAVSPESLRAMLDALR